MIYMDTDLQDPPEIIPQLVEKWRGGVDVVYTTRTARHGESWLRLWLTQLAYRVIHTSSCVEIPVDSGDFKLLSRKVVDYLLQSKEHDPYLRGLVSWIGLKQVPVFYERQPRYAGKSHTLFLGNLTPLRTFLAGLISFSDLPLLWLLLGGGILMALGFPLLIFQSASVSSLLIFLSGAQLFGLGILGTYVRRIYDETTNRPHYLVESLIGFDAEEKKT